MTPIPSHLPRITTKLAKVPSYDELMERYNLDAAAEPANVAEFRRETIRPMTMESSGANFMRLEKKTPLVVSSGQSAEMGKQHPIQFSSPAGAHHNAVSSPSLDATDDARAGEGFFLDEDFVPRTVDQHELDVERPELAESEDDGKPDHF